MSTEQDPPHPAGGNTAEPEEERRRFLRIVTATAIAGAAGLGAWLTYQRDTPILTRKKKDHLIPDHRVVLPESLPALVVARGKSPARNVQAGVERMGGMGRFASRGDRVLIKPNVGWDRTAAQAANTNPEVVAQLVRLCLEAGAASVVVVDNPVNDPERCFSRSGILTAVGGAGGRVVFPSEQQFYMVVIPGKLGRWPVFAPFVEANKIINVPIVKHHSLTRATLGMKNWYGILGGRRNQLHQRIDDSIVELARLMRPTLTVVDATRILMRNGPTGGSLADVKSVGAVAVARDPVAADAWGATQLGLDPSSLTWLTQAERAGLGRTDLNPSTLVEVTTG